MSYFLIGETLADDGPLFVLWTRDASGVRVLPIGSHDRRDMQVVGRRLVNDTTPDSDPNATVELVMTESTRRADGRPLRLVDLGAPAREAIERSIASDLDRTDL